VSGRDVRSVRFATPPRSDFKVCPMPRLYFHDFVTRLKLLMIDSRASSFPLRKGTETDVTF
jgi:hypothetical protein